MRLKFKVATLYGCKLNLAITVRIKSPVIDMDRNPIRRLIFVRGDTIFEEISGCIRLPCGQNISIEELRPV